MEYRSIEEQKKALRKEILKKRNSIAPPLLSEYSDTICKYIMAESKYIRCDDILLYSSFGSEVRTNLIINHALANGKNVFFPKVEGEIMNFYKITDVKELSGGFKGILEPFGNSSRFKDASKSVVIVPGSVFGKDGYRIGYGRGFYDKFLNRFPDIYKIGVCFSNQLVESVPVDDHDIQLDEIVCESFILNKEGKGEARWI